MDADDGPHGGRQSCRPIRSPRPPTQPWPARAATPPKLSHLRKPPLCCAQCGTVLEVELTENPSGGRVEARSRTCQRATLAQPALASEIPCPKKKNSRGTCSPYAFLIASISGGHHLEQIAYDAVSRLFRKSARRRLCDGRTTVRAPFHPHQGCWEWRRRLPMAM